MFAALRKRVQAWTRPRTPEALPARLDRRRIYVLPTASGLFFGLLLGAMLLGALNFNNNPALLLALLLAGAAQASLIAAHMQLSGLRIEAVAAEPVADDVVGRAASRLDLDEELDRRLDARAGGHEEPSAISDSPLADARLRTASR